ncbi:MAG TPA: amidohydrolase [Ilumatobacteraceae bacterium]|nr:amidohydrolase [Ilumatobacteraceae bacterium]
MDADPRPGPVPDLAIVNCTALVGTAVNRAQFAPGATLEITGDRLSRIDANPASPPQAREVIDAQGMVVMPGLINTHSHAAMTFLRCAAEDVAVSSWFNDYIWPMEVNVGARDVYLGTMVAAAEMIECGVTTFADHYFFMDEAARAVADSGLRANLGWAFFSSEGDVGIERSIAFAERYNGAADGRITTCLAPHAPYTVNDDQLKLAADEARRLGVKVHLHAAEDINQTRSSIAARGQTPIQVLEETGVLDAGTIIAHGCGITDDDIPILAHYKDRVGVTHGPKGYLKFALGPLTPIPALQAVGVPVGYCTDGAASNNTLDVFESMRVTAISQKQLADDATYFSSGMALRMAGPESAAVLGMRATAGELRVGAYADVIIVDTSGFHCQPLHDLAGALVYCIQPNDVRTTIVGGKVLMRDRQLLTIDRVTLLAEFRLRAREIIDRTHGRTIQDYAP